MPLDHGGEIAGGEAVGGHRVVREAPGGVLGQEHAEDDSEAPDVDAKGVGDVGGGEELRG